MIEINNQIAESFFYREFNQLISHPISSLIGFGDIMKFGIRKIHKVDQTASSFIQNPYRDRVQRGAVDKSRKYLHSLTQFFQNQFVNYFIRKTSKHKILSY